MSDAPRPRPARPPGSSMSLLTDLMEHPLDPGYQEAADRRTARGEAAASLRGPLLITVCVLTGLLLIIAANSLRVPKDAANQERDQLIGQIHRQQKVVDNKVKDIKGLQGQISAAQRQALGRGDGPSIAEELSRAEVASGAVGVHGPGFQLTLDDAPSDPGAGGNAGSEGEEQTSVKSSDIQVLVNGMWQAGAEAISINGQRLTSQSAIRFAGSAILVDFRPLSRPYVISAIGEAGALKQRFEAGPSGSYLKSLTSQFRMKVKAENKDNLSVPASASLGMHSASPAPASTASASSAQKESP
ncbi:DUF881 domain-containing protein [Luteipulveratus mongoliensis]|uniref:DUF881 domain-containing protein n=1 Tax=Luteipulveratus mongoliensis TaxID=571913 RepID=A0A0K1JJP1_9MICO|nr:DUF881 domain-containing protein [Luteipulveratus mongoliensis]AKU16926.1 hypothetical protein VV02_15435 [Luteipulveratus mongoliensis]